MVNRVPTEGDSIVTAKLCTHHEIAGPVRPSFILLDRTGGRGKAGRVVSGLLNAARKRGDIRVHEDHGRATGCVCYLLTDEQLASIRAEAISRAGRI